jgi:hypothetical protein
VHPTLVEELIAEEVERVRADGLLRDRVRLEQDGRGVLAHARRGDGNFVFFFYGPNYNAEPFQFSVVGPETHEPLPAAAWPPGLAFGSPHPSLARTWTCLLGTYEYHCHPSHLGEHWDRHRYNRDLPTLLSNVLHKAGCS